jgi:type III pantothenate kinase
VLLAVDAGNSQTSFGIFSEGKLRHHWRAGTHSALTPDEYASFLLPLLQRESISASALTGVVLCSVVPSIDRAFAEFAKKYLGRETYSIDHRVRLGFSLGVDFPAEVGADRLANSAYAVAHLKLPAVVVDIGTATTFDVITADKVYQGGMILPGVRLWVESLFRNTAKLANVDLRFPPNVIGKNTVTCIQSGILYGYTDLLDGLIRRLENELGSFTLVFTGGYASLFDGRMNAKYTHLPDLTLEGIELLYRLNN